MPAYMTQTHLLHLSLLHIFCSPPYTRRMPACYHFLYLATPLLRRYFHPSQRAPPALPYLPIATTHCTDTCHPATDHRLFCYPFTRVHHAHLSLLHTTPHHTSRLDGSRMPHRSVGTWFALVPHACHCCLHLLPRTQQQHAPHRRAPPVALRCTAWPARTRLF